jgi:hypothetical protein
MKVLEAVIRGGRHAGSPRQPKARQTFDLAGLFWLRDHLNLLFKAPRLEAPLIGMGPDPIGRRYLPHSEGTRP